MSFTSAPRLSVPIGFERLCLQGFYFVGMKSAFQR
jgi:hypothetical protein